MTNYSPLSLPETLRICQAMFIELLAQNVINGGDQETAQTLSHLALEATRHLKMVSKDEVQGQGSARDWGVFALDAYHSNPALQLLESGKLPIFSGDWRVAAETVLGQFYGRKIKPANVLRVERRAKRTLKQ